MKECFSKSAHDLRAFAMIILGTDPLPTGILVALVDTKSRSGPNIIGCHWWRVGAAPGSIRTVWHRPSTLCPPPAPVLRATTSHGWRQVWMIERKEAERFVSVPAGGSTCPHRRS